MSTLTPLISIIIPTLNSEKVISSALESLICQSYKNIEILVIDGNSTDSTVEKVHAFADRRIKVFGGPDTGIYDAMNRGIGRSTGDWIYFLGSDDQLYDENVFQDVVEMMDRPETVLIYGRAKVVPENFVTPIDISFTDLAVYNLCHQAIFYSRAIFSKYSYDTQFRILADWDLNLKIFARYYSRVVSLDRIIVIFSNTGSSHDWKRDPEYKKMFSNSVCFIWKYMRWQDFVIKLFQIIISKTRSSVFVIA
jgi:glycosyltransferase involved in cell wall biosynthesis